MVCYTWSVALNSINGVILFLDQALSDTPGIYTFEVGVPTHIRDVIAQFTLSKDVSPVGTVAVTGRTVDSQLFVGFGQPALSLAEIAASTPKSAIMRIMSVPLRTLRFTVTVASGTATLDAHACGQ